MPGSPQYIAPSPLEYFSALVAEDASLPLTEAAASLGQDEDPQLDVQSVLDDIDLLAHKLRQRLPADMVPLQKLQRLNLYFFQELGFAGNVNDYYDRANSFLHRVLATRRGIPISLAVVYLEIAAQIGLPARGVPFPGHFLVKVRLQAGAEKGDVVIDPFSGRSLSRHELDDMLLPYRRRHGLESSIDAPLGLFLEAATPREIVARMLRNLKEVHRTAEDWPRLLMVSDRLVVLLPHAIEERRDRSEVLAALGRHAEAAEDLAAYLAKAPGGQEQSALRMRLQALRDAGRQRRH